MALDRQFLVEILDAQGVVTGRLTASRINVTDSKVTGTTPGGAASIATYAGNGQSGTVGANIAIPPAVRVTDANGLPVAGSSVTWFHGGGSGTTSTGTITTTNSNGIAQVGSWSLGTTAGSTYTLFAYSGALTNSPIRFSCTPTASSAFSISASRGTSQTSTPTGTMPSSLSACVHDQYGNPVNGASVTVTTTDAEATIGTAALTTSSNGHAGTTYQVGQSASVASVLFAISSTTSARFDMTTVAGPAVAVTILTGDNQVAAVSTELPLPVTVSVDDGYGNTISSGETIQFVVVQGSGAISRATATPTNSQSSFTWEMGAGAGQNAVEISLENLSNSTVTVFASGTNPLADTIFSVAGIGQSATVGAALGAPLRWGVTGSGSSAAGQVVNLSVTGDAVLSAAQATSTSTGLVNVTVTAGTVNSIYTVTAVAAGLTGSPSEITFAAVVGSATSLIVQTQPTSNPVPGVEWPQQPVVISTDVYGNLVSTNTRVGAALTTGDGTLASSVSMFAVASGATATFSGLSYTQVASNAFQVAYRCNSLSTATGDSQTAQPPFASKLGFTTQPVGGTEGSSIGQVIVAVQDSTGATVGTATDPVTLAIGTNPSGGVLSGTATVAASGGLATFNGLSIDLAGADYTLNATATGLTGATSAPFTMTAASGAHPNEPAGFTEIHDTNFAGFTTGSPAINGAAIQGVNRDAPGTSGRAVVSDIAPFAGEEVLDIVFSANANQGTGPEHLVQSPYFYISNTFSELYTHFWFCVPVGWKQPNGSTVQKLFHINGLSDTNATVPGESLVVPALTGTADSTTATVRFGLRYQEMSTANGGSLSFNSPTRVIARGTWYEIEVYLKYNTGGAADGIATVWIDGVQQIHQTNLTYKNGGAKEWTKNYLNPTYGGSGKVGTTQHLYMRKWYTSGKA